MSGTLVSLSSRFAHRLATRHLLSKHQVHVPSDPFALSKIVVYLVTISAMEATTTLPLAVGTVAIVVSPAIQNALEYFLPLSVMDFATEACTIRVIAILTMVTARNSMRVIQNAM